MNSPNFKTKIGKTRMCRFAGFKRKLAYICMTSKMAQCTCIYVYNTYFHLFSTGAFEPKSKEYDKNDIWAAIIGLSLYQSTCERTAVNGIVTFLDLTEFQMKHQLFWKFDDVKRFADLANVRTWRHVVIYWKWDFLRYLSNKCKEIFKCNNL